ncbi:hypothetical protein [Polaromonas sp.]|uniref:hypothetical protein n=1 Tax=Polaromonas sp. TaxID=1869339 RepID=UPI003BB58271
MSTQNATGFQVGADINPFEAAMRRMVDAARGGQSGVADALGGLGGPLAGLKTLFVGISAILAGGFLQSAITETAQMTEKAMDLGRALGISTNEARAIQIALEDIGAAEGEFEGAAKGMLKQLKDNEAAMNKMGLSTRDASGNLRPMNDLVTDGVKVLGTYKEGTDRALASQLLFGKGVDASSKLMLYNQEVVDSAKKTMEDMSLTVGENSVAAWNDFDSAMDTAGFGVQGMKKAIGDSLMPVAVTLVNMFNSLMPAAIVVVRGALSGLTAGFLFVKNGVVVLWQTINAMIYSVIEPLRGLSEMLWKAMTGDFSGAVSAFKSIGKNVGDTWSATMDLMTDESRKTADQVYKLFARDDQLGSGGGSGAGTKDFVNPKTKKEKAEKAEKEVKEPSYMQTYEAALNEHKLVFEKENTLREFSKQQELDYWQEILNTYTVGSKDRTSIALKMSKLELDILRQGAKDKRAIEQLRAEDYKAETLDFVAELDARAAFERDMGTMSQQDYLARQQGFNALRLQAELDFIAQKIEVAKLDPEANVVALEQLEIQKLEIKRKYKGLESDLSRQLSLESTQQYRSLFGTIEGGWTNAIAGMMSGTQTVGQGLKAMFKTVVDSIIGMLAQMVAKWLVQQLLMLAFGKTMGATTIATKSAEAGAGGVASMAAAPFPMNLTAPFFGAAMAAAAASFGVVASASGGFDIPSGMNPITQLHQEEMVLPASIANPLRESIDSGSTGGGVRQPEGQIRGMPPSEWLMVHRGDLVNALRGAQRDFSFTKF